MDITIRHAEPDDYEAIHRILSGPQAIEGTLQLPLYSLEKRRRWLSEISEGDTVLVACVEDEVVGNLDLRTFPTLWRRRHIGEIGMAVREDWQGRGVGIALYEKFGFEIEGTHPRFAFRGGEYVTAYSMARVRD